MKPVGRQWMAMLLAFLCIGCATAGSAGRGVELRATAGERETASGPKRVLILTVRNHTPKQIAVVKPALPSSWSIDRIIIKDGVSQTEQLRGAAGRGQPDPGRENRYRANQYARIEPGASFSYVTDLDFYISSGLSEPTPGKYQAVFRYEYAAMPEEADLPIVSGPLESNRLAVEIPD